MTKSIDASNIVFVSPDSDVFVPKNQQQRSHTHTPYSTENDITKCSKLYIETTRYRSLLHL